MRNQEFKYSSYFRAFLGSEIPAYIVYTDGALIPRISGETYSMPEAFAVGDFNSDNLDDLVITYGDTYTKPRFYIAQGDGTFRWEDLAPAGSERRHIRNSAVIDLNKDGYLDYVGFCAPHGFYESVLGHLWDFTEPDLVLINQAGNGFRVLPGFPEASHHGGAVGDVNHDGRLDVFGISETASKSWAEPRSAMLQQADETFLKSTDQLSGVFSNLVISDMRIADLNKDQIADYVLTVAPNDGTVNNTPLGTPMSSSSLGVIAYAFGKENFNLNSLNWTFTGEHWMTADIWSRYLVVNDRSGNGAKSYSSGPSNLELLDINGDGLLDVLVGFYVSAPFSWQTSGFCYFRNTGTEFVDETHLVFPNQISNREINSPTGFILGFSLADLDGDGDRDLILTHKGEERPSAGTPSFQIFMNKNGVFEPFDLGYLDFSYQGWAGFGKIHVGDFNGDGAPDLVSFQNAPSGMRIVTSLNVVPNASIGGDVALGTYGNDTIESDSAKIFRGLAGNDNLFGSLGLQSAEYYGPRDAFQISLTPNEEWRVTDQVGNEGQDLLVGIERLCFADKNLALDLDGNAGKVAKVLGAVFGKTALTNKEYVGIGLDLIDGGMGYQDLAALAVSVTKKTTSTDICTVLWTNVIGKAPAADITPFKAMLDSGEISVGALTTLAADTSYNTINIDLVGLSQTGLEYV